MSAASDAVDAVTRLAERTHQRGARRIYDHLESAARHAGVAPARELVVGVATIHKATATLSFGAVRGVNAAVGGLVDLAAQAVAALPPAPAHTPAAAAGPPDPAAQPVGSDPTEPASAPPPPDASSPHGSKGRWPGWIDQAEGALNGLFGDHLAARGNALAIEMGLRHEGSELPTERVALRAHRDPPRRRVCLFVHGLSATEHCWWLNAERFYHDPKTSFGSLLAAELDIQPYYVRFNSGRPIAENGRALADLLEQLDRAHPTTIEDWTLVGHSMGGLLLRHATVDAERRGARWLERLGHVVCLGSPHQGSPVEQGAELARAFLSQIDVAATQVPAAVIGARSAGIRDLHDGVGDLPLLDHVHYTFLGATLTQDPAHPVGRLLGDLLVRVPSATDEPTTRTRPFISTRVFPGMDHLALCNHPDVYAVLKETLEPSP